MKNLVILAALLAALNSSALAGEPDGLTAAVPADGMIVMPQLSANEPAPKPAPVPTATATARAEAKVDNRTTVVHQTRVVRPVVHRTTVVRGGGVSAERAHRISLEELNKALRDYPKRAELYRTVAAAAYVPAATTTPSAIGPTLIALPSAAQEPEEGKGMSTGDVVALLGSILLLGVFIVLGLAVWTAAQERAGTNREQARINGLQDLAGVIGNAAGRLAGHERLIAGGSGTRFDFRVEPANPTPLLPPPPPAQPAPQVYVVSPPPPPAAPAPVNPGVVNVNLTLPPGWQPTPTPPAPPKAPAAAAGGKPPAKKPANPAKAAAGTATP